MVFQESNFENSIMELFDNLGYTVFYGPNYPRNNDFRNPILTDVLFNSLERINPSLPDNAIQAAIDRLSDFGVGTLVLKNEIFMDFLQNGVPVSFDYNHEENKGIVNLIDYKTPTNNSFYAINQWSIEDRELKRPDVVVFLNGLPIVVMELKSPSNDNVSIENAYNQIRNYLKSIESLFVYNAFCVISDHAHTKMGTITSPFDRFMDWKTVNGDYKDTAFADFTTLINGVFEKERLLDIVHNFICFSKDTPEDRKIIAAYHQYFAVKKAVESTLKASADGGDGRGGVFWHTQGSGKSLSMVFYAKLIHSTMSNPTIVVITDRNDLDDQLYEQFVKCSSFLRQTPVHADKRKVTEQDSKNKIGLYNWLNGRQSHGIIFTTMQKFEENDEPLSLRRNIIVIADEAHRSQYGFEEKVNKTTGKITKGQARLVREALPNATYIGFTGTPVDLENRNTIEVFGNYIDIYDMSQSVEDGATRPIYYESRVIKLGLDQGTLEKVDQLYESIKDNASETDIEKSKHELAKMDAVLGTTEVIESLSKDIIEHYEKYRQYEQTGKAMIVAYSRPIAVKLYEQIIKLRPNWANKVKVIMTGNNNDPEDWKFKYTGNKTFRENLAKEFKDDNSEFKIAIVVDMWLTGFDVPSLSTMYIFKPMKGHTLMQSIARVNRVYKNKEGGLVVDYIGIATALKAAMKKYTDRDNKNYGDMDIAKTAYLKFQEKLEVCRSILYGFDYSEFMTTKSDLTRAKLITAGVNFLEDKDRQAQKVDFIKECYAMKQAYSLSKSLASGSEIREEAYLETVRSVLVKVDTPARLSLKEINNQVNEIISQSLHSDGVISLFSDIDKEFNLFDTAFMKEVAEMPEKNLSIELLKKVLLDQIKIYKRTNIVKSELFADMFNKIVNSYLNGMITNEQVIEELMKMADDIKNAQKEGDDLGLTQEELAFYDALTKPAAVKDFYENNELVALTKELTEQLKKSRTIDWEKKESARASMRMMIKRLLKKYKYPPEGVENALQTVIEQCEMWADNQDYYE